MVVGGNNFDVGGGGIGSSPNVERAFSGVGVGRGEGAFTPNVDRCTDDVDFERGRGFGDVSGGFGVGRSSLIDENVPRPQETPSTNKVPSCKLCHDSIDLLTTNKESIDLLTARIESLEKTIVAIMSTRGVRPSSNISKPYTPDLVRRRKRQISKALSSVKKKDKEK